MSIGVSDLIHLMLDNFGFYLLELMQMDSFNFGIPSISGFDSGSRAHFRSE